MWMGILTILLLTFTASIAALNRRGIHKIPLRWHFVMARITVAVAVVHGILGLLTYF